MSPKNFEFLRADNVDKCRRRIPLIRAPVCGSDGKNYSNVYLLKRVSLSVKHSRTYEGCPLCLWMMMRFCSHNQCLKSHKPLGSPCQGALFLSLSLSLSLSFVILFLLISSCLTITLIVCIKGQWQGHLYWDLNKRILSILMLTELYLLCPGSL